MKIATDLYKLHLEEQEKIMSNIDEKIDALSSKISQLISLMGYYANYISTSNITIDNIKDRELISYPRFREFKIFVSTLSLDSANRNNLITLVESYKNTIHELMELEIIKDSHQYMEYVNNLLFNHIIKEYNKYVIKRVIKGDVMSIGNQVGNLSIKIYNDNKRIRNGSVDWNESLNILLSIAKKQEEQGLHNYYTKYNNKEIKKKDFISSMKKFIYNKDTNPNGDKWLIYRNNVEFPVIRWEGRSHSIANIKQYSFIPSNYINTPSRSQNEFAANAKNEDEILDSNKLGFRDKLNVCLTFNPDIKFRYDDIRPS